VVAGGWFRRIFVNHNIFYLWSGQVVSQAGDSIYEIGLLWLLLELTGSNAQTGLIAMAAYLPTLLFGLFSGALVDRIDRRRLMLVADAVRAGIVLLVPILFWLNGLSGLVLGLLTFGVATFNTLFNPARDALVGDLVEPDNRMTANSMIQTSWQYSSFLGPALAGLLLGLLGQIHLFSADALTFLISYVFIYRIGTTRRKNKPKAPVSKTGLWEEFSASLTDVSSGLNYARNDRRIWALLIITAVDNLFLMGPALVGAPIFIREVLGGDIASFARIHVAYAIGMLIGTILLNRYGSRFRNGRVVLWGIILDGLTFFPLLWVKTFTGMFITFMFHAMAIPLIIVSRPTIVQNIVPAALQGRVFSMIAVAVFGLTAISIAATGILAEVIPMNVIYAIIAILAASTGAAGWFVKEFREIE
jgi:MFS family permease